MTMFVLLGHEGRNAAFEETNTTPEQDQTKDESSQCSVWSCNDLRDRSNDDEYVANSSQPNGYVDGLELAPILVGKPAT